MKNIVITLLLCCLSITVSAQSAGGQVRRPAKKATITQKVQDNQKRSMHYQAQVNREKRVVVDGIEYIIRGNEASMSSSTIGGIKTETVIIPNFIYDDGKRFKVTKIEGGFKYKTDTIVKHIVLNNNIKTISRLAFSGCRLVSVFIPATVEYIDCNPFYQMGTLEKIEVDSQNKWYDSRQNCNAIIEKKSAKLISACRNTKIPKGVRIIGKLSYESLDVEEVNIPEGVITIEEQAFRSCKKLTNVKLPSTLRRIEYEAFGDSNIGEIELPSSLTFIGDKAFAGCKNMVHIVFPQNLTYLKCNTFMWTSLQEVRIPPLIKEVDVTFLPPSLKYMYIPNGCKIKKLDGYPSNDKVQITRY